jgi:peptidoglycan/LPS O-acetylase OafA/YrhL
LFPALLVLLVGYLVILLPIIQRFSPHSTAAALQEALYAFGYVTNWGSVLNQLHAPFLGHTWSLAIEEQFYMVWPVLLVLLLRWLPKRMLDRSIVMLTMAAWLYRWLLVVNGASLGRVYVGSDTRADLLLIGAAAAAWRWNGGQLRDVPRWLPWVGLGSIGTIIWNTNAYDLLVNLFLSPGIALLSVWLIVVLVAPVQLPLRAWLACRSLVWLGQRSYGIYLWHHPLMVMLHMFALPRIAVLLVGAALSVAIAAASYRYVELPVMRWARACFGVR